MDDNKSEFSSVLSDQEKVVSLFQFIQELNKLKQKAILNIKEYPWERSLLDIPNDPENIILRYQDRVAEEEQDKDSEDNLILSVHKPEFQRCPLPEVSFEPWLAPGWDDFRGDAIVIPSMPGKEIDEETGNPKEIFFADNPKRQSEFAQWLESRKKWAEQQRTIAQTRDLFTDLYRLYFELKRESETEEMIAANGFIQDREHPEVCHPIVTHRVRIDYDADMNTVSVYDAPLPSELYTVAFQVMDGINLGEINILNEDLKKNDYHPLDRNETPGFLKVLIHQLSSDSTFSDTGVPANWEKSSRLLLYLNPCLIVRKRIDGTLKAIEQIIENVQETGEVPGPIRDIVSGGTMEVPEDSTEESIEEQLAAVGGESVDILLSKPANKEQLNIARRIEQYNAVLVQGPPGTGKTHTIANLLGHFLAQGKSILVTSYTSKALRVLKEKISPGLQNLCVSMLDDSNVDMERSVNGITDYMSQTTAGDIQKEMTNLSETRKDIIKQLAATRKKLFTLIQQECNTIVYNGEELSPSAAAQFVVAHSDDLSYIPGKVRVPSLLPLSFEQLANLYRSNGNLTEADEQELECGLPSPEEIASPEAFEQTVKQLTFAQRQLDTISSRNGWTITASDSSSVEVSGSFGIITLTQPPINEVRELKDHIRSIGRIDKWMQQAAVDGKAGGAYRQRWLTLIAQIQAVCKCSESVLAEQFGQDVEILDASSVQKETLETIRRILAEKGKISKLAQMLHKEYAVALECAKISGHFIQTAQDCDLVLHQLELLELRGKCAKYWDVLMTSTGMPAFFDLDRQCPETIADNLIPEIQRALDWYQEDFTLLVDKMEMIGIPGDVLFAANPLDSDYAAAEKQFSAIATILPQLCELCEAIHQSSQCRIALDKETAILMSGKRGSSHLCKNLRASIESLDGNSYAENYAALKQAYEKYTLQNNRENLLKQLEPVAPDWADAIRQRIDIHGESSVPASIEDAWKWKQLQGILEEITAEPFQELQAKSLLLSKKYREVTALFAEKCAWYHLLLRTESNITMHQALQGWKLTVKRIGKGTGKTAPKLKAEARKLMSQCQAAVPAWIMPINKALESLNPKENKFDIVIIDEASQSDISSLAILYMGKKLIIVGDDQQVSPMAVGIDSLKMDALEQMYLHGKIPNAQLYNAKTSIYDIAATTFKPLMLHEHFRCVPEIIGFSNMLSYEYQIKPLREASSSNLLPAVVNYRVDAGQRDGKNKVNIPEAKAVVALMRACMEQPEYSGKTFGVISLLGDAQYQLIQKEIDASIPPKEIIRRNILCGNSANFQGDERDVIFLSLVDSKDIGTPGPLHLLNYGVDDSNRKRYNVAASRAKDQLWVVHSLDAANDLKPGDIRKQLLDYSANPQAFEYKHEEIRSAAESEFEVSVATSLSDRGYHLIQQWKVGGYRIDMVAVYRHQTVAIECDGEKFHSGDAKIREDMERQAILERLGWRFIRIRGSEYYHAPAQTIERVIQELTEYGIEPENTNSPISSDRASELSSRVKERAAQILSDVAENSYDDSVIIETALNSKSLEQLPNLGTQSDTRYETVDRASSPAPAVPAFKPKAKPNIAAKPQVKIAEKEPAVDTKKVPTILREPVLIPGVSGPRVLPETVEQQVIPGMEQEPSKSINTNSNIIDFLKRRDVHFVDKRSNGGALWLIGGSELKPIISEAEKLGIRFHFKEAGGKATKGAPGWWAK